jgi:hypothetical protein
VFVLTFCFLTKVVWLLAPARKISLSWLGVPIRELYFEISVLVLRVDELRVSWVFGVFMVCGFEVGAGVGWCS